MSLQKTRVGYLQVPIPAKDMPTLVADLRTLGVAEPAEPLASAEQIAAVAAKVEAARAALKEVRPERGRTALWGVRDRSSGPPHSEPRTLGSDSQVSAMARRRRIARAVLVVVIGLLAALSTRSMLRAQRERTPRGQSAVSPLPPVARSAVAPARAAPQGQLVAESADAAHAARSFALGEYERALRQYRWLAREHPEQPAYPAMIKVLAARVRER